ncbi:ankyrin repeat-containing protein NPR4-like [Musa acuminata AAA Group]|uniref:ankyrin repeat-containing protein NPR4-like n=1 Tax=Musa acuminata AAA Group TaxID=214697 RepID=UPI0031E2858C
MQITESVPELFTPMSPELLEAARLGNTNILGTSFPDVHVTAGGNSMLHIAANQGHTDFCKKALDLQPFLLRLKNARGDTPLHVAARAGHHQLVNDLISTASERSAQDDDGVRSLVQMANDVGNTALHEAVQNGHEQVVDALMAKAPGVSAVTNNVNGVSPLYMAVESWSTSIVRLLLAADVASCDGPNGQTALHVAVLRSYVRCYDWFNLLLVVQSFMVLLLMTNGSRFSPQRRDAIRDRWRMQREKDRINETLVANNMSVMAVLVATVAFAAAFTLPGGYKSDESNDPGMPILLKRTAFKVFLIFDTLAMTTSFLVLVHLLQVGLGSKTYKNWFLPEARLMLQISLLALMAAFASGLYPLIAGECFWLFILICVFLSIYFLYFLMDQPLILYCPFHLS